MKTIGWRREPKGPGPAAFHMFLDAGGERVELLAYDVPADRSNPRMCGFEIFGRLRNRDGILRLHGPFYEQLAAGEATSLEEAQNLAVIMASQPRQSWRVLPRSWLADQQSRREATNGTI